MQDAGVPTPYTKHPEVAAALRRLYAVKVRRPPGERWRHWQGYWRDEVVDEVEREWAGGGKRVRELDERVFWLIGPWAVYGDRECAEATWYFLPRLLDSVCHFYVDEYDRREQEHFAWQLEELAAGLSVHDLRAWPGAFVDAMEVVAVSLWWYWQPLAVGGGKLFGSLLMAGIRFGTLRAAWESWPEDERADRLLWVCVEFRDRECWDRIWGEAGVPRAVQAEVARWMSSSGSLELLRTKFFAAKTDTERVTWSSAEQAAVAMGEAFEGE